MTESLFKEVTCPSCNIIFITNIPQHFQIVPACKHTENYNKLLSFIKQEIKLREHVCTTNHAVLLDNAKQLLKEIGELND